MGEVHFCNKPGLLPSGKARCADVVCGCLLFVVVLSYGIKETSSY